jgi:hypothetical protein
LSEFSIGKKRIRGSVFKGKPCLDRSIDPQHQTQGFFKEANKKLRGKPLETIILELERYKSLRDGIHNFE